MTKRGTPSLYGYKSRWGEICGQTFYEIPWSPARVLEHVELFDLMEDKQNGVIEKLIIQDGLPFLAELEFE